MGIIVRFAAAGVKFPLTELVKPEPDGGDFSGDSLLCSSEGSEFPLEGKVGVPDFPSSPIADFEGVKLSGDDDSSDEGRKIAGGRDGFCCCDSVSCAGKKCTAFVKHL